MTEYKDHHHHPLPPIPHLACEHTGGGPPVRPAVPLIKDYVIPKYDWTKAHAKKRLDIDAVLLDIRKTKSSPKIQAPIFKVRGKREVESMKSMVSDGELQNFLLVMSLKSAND